jgi:hypothetical protein
MPWLEGPALSQFGGSQDHGHKKNGNPIGAASQHRRHELADLDQQPVAPDLETEQGRQLADQHGEGDAIHVAVADRLGEQFGDETQASGARQKAQATGDEGQHRGQGHGALGIPRRHRQHDAEDEGDKRRIRPITRIRLGPKRP